MTNHKELVASLIKQDASLSRIYSSLSSDIARVLKKYRITNNSKLWFKNAAVKKEMDAVLKKHQSILFSHISTNATQAWNLSNKQNDAFVNNYIKGITIPNQNFLLQRNTNALSAFLKRRDNGLNLSDRVWNITKQTQSQLEYFIAEGLTEGRSATNMAKDLQRYLKDEKTSFRRIRDKTTGKLKISNPASGYHPGRGVYRSSYKNALRLARNETNIAFRTSDFERRKQLPFVLGVTVHLSPAHPQFDICDDLQGDYPKQFKFTGWHPNCYDEKTEVYTDKGWLKFSHVTTDNKILSLTDDKNLDWANIDFTIKKEYSGKMVRFSNRSLDMMVTPDHPMVYLSKSKKDVIYSNKTADEYDKNKGGLYRSSNYSAPYIKTIKIGEHEISFKKYCEFMGYYLSDGSISRKYAVIISQRKSHDPDNYKNIYNLLKSIGIDFHNKDGGFFIYDETLWNYLKPFGKCNEKFIPEIIKNSHPEQIKVFLDAFVSCDGYIRKNKSFVGNRGNLFVPKKLSRMFFTTSKRMADDMGELLLKIGKRPSFNEKKTKGKEIQYSNGIYINNYNLWVISECHSQTATVFNKEYIDYDGFVYDVQLDRDHILLTRRNGKVVWGSNCLCFTTAKLASKKDFINHLKGKGIPEERFTNTIPDRASIYLNKNADRIKGFSNTPYFIRDNFKNTKNGFSLKSKTN